MHTSQGLWRLCLAGLAAWPLASPAGNFIGLGQPGPPGWSLQFYPTWSAPLQPQATVSTFVELSYFLPTGFTGTARDRHQFWVAAAVGHAKPAAGSSDRASGLTGQQVAYEYYYRVIEPAQTGDLSWWTTPLVSLSFPNGETKASGFGAGGNQSTLQLGWNNHLSWDRWNLTFAPLSVAYADRARHATPTSTGVLARQRAGWSLTWADLALGYRVTPDLDLGWHYAYSQYHRSASDLAPARQGRMGPSFAYLGLMPQHRIYLAGNLSRDVQVSPGMKPSTTWSAVLVKFF